MCIEWIRWGGEEEGFHGCFVIIGDIDRVVLTVGTN